MPSRNSAPLNMLENPSDYSSSVSSETKVDIAPPAMAEPAKEETKSSSSAFFASPESDNDMEVGSSLAAAATSSTSTTTATRKVVKFFQDNSGDGIMMESNKPFPTEHKVMPLKTGSKIAVPKPQGLMMAVNNAAVPPAPKTKETPAESSTTVPNTASFKWKQASLDGSKVVWQQREIDCMIQPAHE